MLIQNTSFDDWCDVKKYDVKKTQITMFAHTHTQNDISHANLFVNMPAHATINLNRFTFEANVSRSVERKHICNGYYSSNLSIAWSIKGNYVIC